MDLNKILVVFDPTKEKQPALDRALVVAREFGPMLHIFACIDASSGNVDKKNVNGLIRSQQEAIEAYLASVDAASVSTVVEVEHDKDWYQAVIRAASRTNADVVFKSSFVHSVGQRALKKTSDWTLIRECSCPVLLVKENAKWDARKILAAVDIRAQEGAYAKLNDAVIALSKTVLGPDVADVHFINAYNDSLSFPDRNALMRACDVPSEKIHIEMGSPEEVIVSKADMLDASLVVLGSSGRSGVSALFRGNTAEKILDAVNCDVLAMPA